MLDSCFFRVFSSFNGEKARFKYYNNQIKTHGNGQEESRLNSTIIANSATDTLIDDKIIKLSFNENNVATIKNKQNFVYCK